MPSVRLRCALACLVLLTACPSPGGGGGGPDGGAPDPFKGLVASQDIKIPGLTGRVEVLRDEYGVAHIFCTTDIDCIRAEGFLQAHDRLFEMDFYRHLAEGRLGEQLGKLSPQIRAVDRYYRRMFTSTDGQPVVQHIADGLDPDTKKFIQAFSDGVNAYIDALPTSAKWAKPSDEYQFALLTNGQDIYSGNAKPEPWTLNDTLAVARFFTFDLSETFEQDLTIARYAGKLGPQMFHDLVPSKPMDPTFIVPGFYTNAVRPPFLPSKKLIARMKRIAPLVSQTRRELDSLGPFLKPIGKMPASNNWIVSATKSATGHPLVADDPHLQLLSPSIWWEVHVDSTSLPGATGSLKFEGTIFPGTPGIIIGHTQHVGWAVTVAGYDVTDAYVETVSGVDKVRFNGQDVDVVKSIVKMPYGPGASDYDQEKICVVPEHGPIISVAGMSDDDLANPTKPCVDPAVGTTAMTAKWVGQQPTYEITAVYKLLHAKTIADAKTALNDFGVGAQNWVVGDTAGDIMYYPHAKVPIRSGDLTQNPPFMPLPGDGTVEWTGFIPNADIPQTVDPAAGFVATANNDLAGVTADDNPLNDKYYLYFTRDLGVRAGRITRLLQKSIADHGHVTVADMKAIQNDSYWEFAKDFVPYIEQAGTDDPTDVTSMGLADALSRLSQWSGQTPTGLDGPDAATAGETTDPTVRADSVATTIFASWFLHAMDRTFGDELKAKGLISNTKVPLEQPLQKALYFAISDPNSGLDGYFDDVSTPNVTETKDQIILGALKDAIDELTTKLGANPDEWLWGRLHQSNFPSPFGVLGVNDQFAVPSVANNGAMHTIDVSNYDRNYQSGAGPSMRIVTNVDPAGVDAWQVIPGGEIDFLGNPNRDDQMPMWLSGDYPHLAFDLPTAISDAEARAKSGLNDPGARWILDPK